ncbi:MAG: nucleotidyltransferase domain-containing protein, partial [Pseudobdellovibrionaceae bacterium]
MESTDTNPILNQITEKLKSQFQPKRLYLYGSRAQGTARPDSDYDFVMVISH